MEVITLTDFDLHLMGEGTDLRIYEKLGAHLMTVNGRSGVRFAVWAPNAKQVSVVGDFNKWNGRLHTMHHHSGTGIWELFVPNLGQGTVYKYEIQTHYKGYRVNKTDPVGFASELRPANASVVWDLSQYEWGDEQWLAKRAEHNSQNSPISIYEVHLGSWRRKEADLWLSYAELAEELIPYVQEMGATDSDVGLRPAYESTAQWLPS